MTYGDIRALALAKRAARDGTGRQLRIALGASQSAFASACGVSPATVTRWENRSRTPSGAAAIRYGRLLQRFGLKDDGGASSEAA